MRFKIVTFYNFLKSFFILFIYFKMGAPTQFLAEQMNLNKCFCLKHRITNNIGNITKN